MENTGSLSKVAQNVSFFSTRLGFGIVNNGQIFSMNLKIFCKDFKNEDIWYINLSFYYYF